MENFTLVALGIIVLWLIAITFYLVVSRQQTDLSKDVAELEELIREHEENSD